MNAFRDHGVAGRVQFCRALVPALTERAVSVFLGKLDFLFAFLPTTAPSPLSPTPLPLMKHLDRGQETIYNHPKVTANKHKPKLPATSLAANEKRCLFAPGPEGRGSLSAQLLLEQSWQKPRQLRAMGGSGFNLLPVQAEQSGMGRKDVGISSCCYFSP